MKTFNKNGPYWSNVQKKSEKKLKSAIGKIENGTILLQGDQSFIELHKSDLPSVSIIGIEKSKDRIKSANPSKSKSKQVYKTFIQRQQKLESAKELIEAQKQ